MINKNVKEILKFLNNNQFSNIIQHIQNEIDVNFIDEYIVSFKKMGLFIDCTGENKYKDFIKQLKDALPMLSKYCEELEIINLMFVEERKMQSYINSIPRSKRLSSILYYLNKNYMAALKKYKKFEAEQTEENDPMITLNGVELLFNTTFKSLIYDEIWRNGKFCFNAFMLFNRFSHLKKSRDYTRFSSITYCWDIAFKHWKQNYIEIFYEGEKIVIKYRKVPELFWLRNSKAKLEIYDQIRNLEIAMVAEFHSYALSSELTNTDELRAWEDIKTFLHISDLNTLINDVPIKYWMRAYSVIIIFSKKVNFINYLSDIVSSFLSNIIFVKKRECWIRLFIKNDIPRDIAEKIFNNMIYNNKSTDLYDYPFVKIKEKYMIIPLLLSVGDPAKLLTSRIRQNDFNISNKGKLFEKELIKYVQSHNLASVQLHNKIGNEEYECDLAFIMDETLFLCECKDNGDKAIINYEHDFYKKDLEQFKRISSFYETNLELVKDKFLKEGFKINNIRNIEKMLIYNTVFHSVINTNGIRIVDSARFISFFRRGSLDKRIYQVYNGPYQCLNIKPTAQNFIKFVDAIIPVVGYDKIVKSSLETLKFGELTIDIEVEQCNVINREEIIYLIDPLYYEKKEFLVSIN